MFLPKLTVCLLLIIAFADAQSISCGTSCVADVTAEDDRIDSSCYLENFGAIGSVLIWYNKLTGEELQKIPPQKQESSTISRNFNWKAVAPKVVPLVCLARIPNVGDVECETRQCNILYSVRNVVTWPLLSASPGEKINCKADGHPAPDFKWQRKEKCGDSEWKDVTAAKSEKIDAQLQDDGTSVELRCVATNSFRDVEFSKYSLAVTVSKDDTAIRTKIIIGVVVGIVILVIIGGLVYKFCFSGYRWPEDRTMTTGVTPRSFTAATRDQSPEPLSPAVGEHCRTLETAMVNDSPVNQPNKSLPEVVPYNYN